MDANAVAYGCGRLLHHAAESSNLYAFCLIFEPFFPITDIFSEVHKKFTKSSHFFSLLLLHCSSRNDMLHPVISRRVCYIKQRNQYSAAKGELAFSYTEIRSIQRCLQNTALLRIKFYGNLICDEIIIKQKT